MAVLTLATVAVGLTFHLQMADTTGNSLDLPESLWNSMLMADLGDNAAGVEHSSASGLVVCFFLLTLIVNVIMMNVLIAIVSQTQERILYQADPEYARFWGETLHGMDTW